MKDYSDTILAIVDMRRSLRKMLSEAWDFARVWAGLCPVEHRLAMPGVMLIAWCVLALAWGWPKMAALCSFGWSAFLRPGEFLRAHRRDLVLPSDVLASDRSAWLRIVEPKTRFRGPRRQLARSDEQWVIALMEAVYRTADPDSRLWPGSDAAFRRRWDAIGKVLWICTQVGKGVTPASLRAGGITAHYLATEDLTRLQRRARWNDLQQIATYVQEVSPLEFLARLGEARRRQLELTASLLHCFLPLALDLLKSQVPESLWYPSFVRRADLWTRQDDDAAPP